MAIQRLITNLVENALRHGSAEVEIETHIDPMSPHVMAGVDIDPVAREEIVAALREPARKRGSR